ncbi:MAG TPA: M15 family metallopeptidase [Gaiellaceae bacterium]|nr:M15 family metallopeptidase [Gaiellaceae bacterium]
MRHVLVALGASALLAAVVAGAATPSDTVSQGESAFRGTISRIDAAQAKRMTGVSWRRGCPVPLRDLRLLRLSHWGFDGRRRTGRLVVHRDVARDLVTVFRRLYQARFPIRRMVPVDAYGASDFRSIEADNTSAFNCRFVEGTHRWSEHAYGRAIDVNPIENPYVSGGRTSHRASIPYVDRSRRRPGMAVEGSVLVRAFDAIGWGWGGRWSGVKDYQHFSRSGR